jgi:hypothetical protein
VNRLDASEKPFLEMDRGANFCPASRPGESEPVPAVLPDALEQENLDDALSRVPAEEPRVPDADVVAHEEVARPEEVGQLGELAMCDRAARAIENEERPRPAGAWILGDAVAGEQVVEERDAHGP